MAIGAGRPITHIQSFQSNLIQATAKTELYNRAYTTAGPCQTPHYLRFFT